MKKNSRKTVIASMAFVIALCGIPLLRAAPPPKTGAKKPPVQNETALKTPAQKSADSTTQPGYHIDQPGTITFTVGMVIKGKIEKPQVMIFLPKDKSYYRELKFNHSFIDELSEPLPFAPLVE